MTAFGWLEPINCSEPFLAHCASEIFNFTFEYFRFNSDFYKFFYFCHGNKSRFYFVPLHIRMLEKMELGSEIIKTANL
jgi:hypothetical protein